MSCEVKIFAKISDLNEVQTFFGFSGDEYWLNAVFYSISPTGEAIAFAHGCKIVILISNQWSQTQNQSNFTIGWRGELENPNEIITNIICLPIYGPNVHSGADWTCIAIGLSSGLVLFYTDSGIQIFSQRWHNESVQCLKAQSGYNQPEEIHIGYQSCVCILQGQQIFSVLKAVKQNLNRNYNKPQTSVPDTVPCRKWEYRQRSGGTINDSVVVGLQETSAFDNFLEQSLEKGFYSKSRSSPPIRNLIVGVGLKPYAGFYYGKEGFIQPDLGDVAKAVANKVLSSLPTSLSGWFKSSTIQDDQQQQQVIQPGEAMQCKFGICDIQRQGFNIWLAPGNRLAAVSDNLHRVLLIDCNRGVALRIWKGYRDAQCSFIRAKEKTLKGDKTIKRKSLFLVIYSPRMSCMEIWTLQNGAKVAAFSVSKNGQLSYNNYGLLNISMNAKPKFNIHGCLFLDPSDNTLKEITVPFHCALSEENSKTAKDVHLLRRMKTFLRSDIDDETKLEEIIEEFETLCRNLQTDEIRLQCLELLAKNKRIKPVLFQAACAALRNSSILNQSEGDNSDNFHLQRSFSISGENLTTLLENYENLVEFYIGLQYENSPNENVKISFKKFNLTENDLKTIQNLLDLSHLENSSNSHNQKVKFQEKQQQQGDFVDYLSIFNVNSEQLELNDQKSELFGFIGGNLFGQFLNKGQNLNAFFEITKRNLLNCDILMSLVINYWLEKPFNYLKCEEIYEDMARLAIIIQHICDLAEDGANFEYDSISPWWQNIRESLLECPSALRGLLTAIVCRNVAVSRQFNEDSSNDEYENNWEEVSQETAQWSLLIGKLDDVSVLGAILSVSVMSSNPVMPTIPYEKPDCSLKSILCTGGKGIVSELVSKWLTNSGIDPKKLDTELVKSSNTQQKKTEEIPDADAIVTDDEDTPSKPDPVLVYLKHLRQHFPFSLDNGLLITQMAWEFFCHWSKNLQNLEFLKAGLACLDTFKKSDLALEHGLCCMIWNAHLKIPLEAIKKIIQKVGKLPNNHLCQQDIGMPVSLIPEFLESSLEFLKCFQLSMHFDKRELKFEEILQDSQVPLTFLALQQNHAIEEILRVHVELIKVLHLIAYFQLKFPKPISTLFDTMSNETFFAEINRELSYSLLKADQVLQKNRELFLCKTVSASMDLIREDLERLYVLEHQLYMEKILELAFLWDTDKSVIEKHQVVELYAHGWDTYAEELLESIVDQESIGPLLLEIAGRRLNLYSSNSQSIFCQVASIGTQLLNYLDFLKEKAPEIPIAAERPDEIELASLTQLASKSFQCLSAKESKNLRIAGQLFDACMLLKANSSKK